MPHTRHTVLLLLNQSISQPTTSTKYGQRGELQEGKQAGELLTRHTVLLRANQSINQLTTGTKYRRRCEFHEGEQVRELLTRHIVLLLPINLLVNRLPVPNMGSNSRRASRRGNFSPVTPCSSWPINQSINQLTIGTKYERRCELLEGEQVGELLTRHTVLLLANQTISQPTTGTKYAQHGELQEGEQARNASQPTHSAPPAQSINQSTNYRY
jgi:hypothetical protein